MYENNFMHEAFLNFNFVGEKLPQFLCNLNFKLVVYYYCISDARHQVRFYGHPKSTPCL